MSEHGGVSRAILWSIAAAVTFLVLMGVACSACFNKNDDHGRSLGWVELIRHDRDGRGGDSGGEQGSGNDQRRCHGARGDCRGSFSPGPFDRSPIDIHDNCISPDCSGRSRKQDPPPANAQPRSLTNPAKLPMVVAQIVKSGLDLGQLFADATIKFVGDLFVALA